MKITNHNQLPEVLFQAIKLVNAKYSAGNADISITSLIDSPRIRILKLKHEDELEEDCSDMLYRFYGQLVHEILAKQKQCNVLIEERLYVEVDGMKISGQPDIFDDNGTLSDYKFTSKYSFSNGVKIEYERQINCYAFLLRENGFTPKKLIIEAMFRNANQYDSKTGTFAVRLWKHEEVYRYIKERVASHRAAEAALVHCSEEERWCVQPKWALMKNSNKKAVKLYDTKAGAFKRLKELEVPAGLVDYNNKEVKDKYRIEERPGEDKRCSKYCIVNKYCDYYLEKTKCTTT